MRFHLPIAAALAFAACTPAPPTRQPTDEALWIEASPPAPLPEPLSDPPWAGAIWLAGFWNWGGVSYAWIPGRWEQPRPGWTWQPHHWERRGPHWRFLPGRWQAAR